MAKGAPPCTCGGKLRAIRRGLGWRFRRCDKCLKFVTTDRIRLWRYVFAVPIERKRAQ